MDLSMNYWPSTARCQLTTGMASVLVLLLAAPQAATANDYALGPQSSEVAAIGQVDFVEPDSIGSENGVLDTVLEVVLVDQDGVRVDCSSATRQGSEYYRAYLIEGQAKPKPTGPTLKFAAGDTVRILLKNQMCEGDDEHSAVTFEGNPPQVHIGRNTTHGINHTNLHTHGLWVSPAGNSDNVLISVAPQTEFQFEYLIPEGHVPGTHWYHPHKHGSVATQVQTGMSGALIMTGGIDEIEAVKQASERVMVIQKFRSSNRLAAQPMAAMTAAELRFPEDQVTTINGVRGPTIKGVAPGHTERWRIISAMASSRLNIWVEKAREEPDQCDNSVETSVSLHPIAYDGIPVAKVHAWQKVRLYPGNRADLMLRFDEPGGYVICNTSDTDPSARGEKIGYVQVDQPRVNPMIIPETFDSKYRHPSLLDDTDVKPNARQVLFSENYGGLRIDNKTFDPNRVDQRIRLGAKEEWILKNDSLGVNRFHPYHIHVNPFQLVASSDPIYGDERMEGVWLDVVGLPGSAEEGPDRSPGYVTVRSHFKKFIGLYVIHCHILGHEDRGMMQIVEVY